MSTETPNAETVTAANIVALYAAGRRDFKQADLRGADLRWADLRWANLREADLRGADLRWANLLGADLREADLRGADLREADLREADLSWANLLGADLSWAKLRGAKNIDAVTAALLMRCPAEGAFIAWKQCRGGSIIKLSVPAEARRSSATGYKCRAEFVDVIEGEGMSIHDGNTVYTPGQRVTCHEWDANRWNECGGGIHFYMSREEAEAHS